MSASSASASASASVSASAAAAAAAWASSHLNLDLRSPVKPQLGHGLMDSSFVKMKSPNVSLMKD